MRVAHYARVSTDRQAEKYGISSQVEALKKRSLEKGWTPVIDGGKDAFIDDGYSGADLDRPALNRLRQAAREGRIDIVLVYDPDRLSRKLFHQMILAEEFEKQGIKLEFVTQEMGTSPEDRMFFNMRGLVSEYEREKIRERTIRGSREKARQGKVVNASSVAYGYRYNKEKATLEEDPEKAPIIRMIFHAFAEENLSLQRLAEKLNRLHIPTPRGGDRWRASTLGAMLRNETYRGKLNQFRNHTVEPKFRRNPLAKNKKTSAAPSPRDEWITVNVPEVIQAGLFEIVQRKLKTNADLARRNTKREYLLSGLLICSRCGGRMGGHDTHGVLYYRCYRRSILDKIPLDAEGNRQPCSCPEIKTEMIEKEVWETICQLIREPDYLIEELGRHNRDDSQKEVVERELKLCQSRLKAIPEEQRRLVEGYRKGLYADFMMHEDMDSIQKEQGELERRKNELERKIAQRYLSEDNKVQIRQLAEDMGNGLDNLDFTGRQKLLRLLVEKVIYDGQNIEIQTIVRPREQLHPIGRGPGRGCTTNLKTARWLPSSVHTQLCL